MNNGRPHDYSKQEFAGMTAGCTFYFDNAVSEHNFLALRHNTKDVLLFHIVEDNDSIDVHITIPDKFTSSHYKNGKVTDTGLTERSHLTYHGKTKRNKISGEIHIKTNGTNPLKGQDDKTAAPVAASSNIRSYPLPLTRIELSEKPGVVTSTQQILNFCELASSGNYFNTVEVHLSRKGFAHGIAAADEKIPEPIASLFANSSLHLFYLKEIRRRPGLFPQILVLQTKTYELIVLATHEYENPAYQNNSIRYFLTRDYFKELGDRSVIAHAGGWFIDQSPGQADKPGAVRIRDLFGK